MGSGKIKIFVLGRDKIGWSIDKDREAVTHLLKANNFVITNNIFRAKFIFCVWYTFLLSKKYWWLKFWKKLFNKRIIAVATNDITFYKEKIESLKELVDVWIAPSKKAYDFFSKQRLEVYKIPFFVDSQVFEPLKLSKQEICKKLGMDYKKIENKVVIGSFQRDSLGKDLSKPKWHKNPDLLISVLKKLPKEKFIFLLAGPRRHYIIKRCLEEKINFLFCGDYSYIKNMKDDVLVNNSSLETVNFLYNLSDLYIISSKSEGGPKAVMESSLTRTMIFSTYVGLAPDMLHRYVLFKVGEINAITEKIKKFFLTPKEFDSYIDYNFQKIKKEMDVNILKEKYRKVFLENLK